MNHLDCPDLKMWQRRKEWFEKTMEEYEGQGSYFVSEQACALIIEVQSMFCVGAWIGVIVFSLAVVDAQLRET